MSCMAYFLINIIRIYSGRWQNSVLMQHNCQMTHRREQQSKQAPPSVPAACYLWKPDPERSTPRSASRLSLRRAPL